jgi:threonine/homoserine/homoserine lactone efflux protein
MDAGRVFVLVLSAIAIGAIIYLQWLSVRSGRESPPSTDESDQAKGEDRRKGDPTLKNTDRRR